MNWLSPLEIPLIRNALLGIVFAGGTMSLLGVMVLTLSLTGLRFTLMHVGLLGAALSMSVGANPTLGAFVLIMLVSVFMGTLGDKVKLSASSLSGFFMTGSLALAFIILSKAEVPAMEVFGIFAGSILILSTVDFAMIILLGLVIVAVYIVGYREIQLILLDKELALTLGVPVGKVNILMFLLLGAGVALALRLVGALLVDAVILLPAMAALPLASGLKQALVLTSLFGITAAAGGFLLALYFDLPIGSSVALLGAVLLGFSYIIQRRK